MLAVELARCAELRELRDTLAQRTGARLESPTANITLERVASVSVHQRRLQLVNVRSGKDIDLDVWMTKVQEGWRE